MKRFGQNLSPQARRRLRGVLVAVVCAAVLILALLLLRGAEALQDIFRAGLTDLYYN